MDVNDKMQEFGPMRLIDTKNFFKLYAILPLVTRGQYFTFYTPLAK